MRIAQLAPLAESIPPKLYGGTERVVSWLTEELVALGHEVTLFASADSATAARLVPVWPSATRLSRPRPDPLAPIANLLARVAAEADRFDVIHCHVDWVHLPLLQRLAVPFVTTTHGRLDLPYLKHVACTFPDAPFVSISNNQREPLPELNWIATVYHGQPPETCSPSNDRGSYLAFLGRIAPEKGPDAAIKLAAAAGLPLRIAAKVPREGSEYFNKRIKPLMEGNRVEFVGEVGDKDKAEFLRNAAALVFPIDWPEPFGLVMMEAMACGTPTVAYRRGSVPEIIEDGVSGFVVDDESQAVAAIARARELDRREVRAAFERRFTARRMAEEYVRVYRQLTGDHRRTEDVTTAAG
ncbi:MAG: glycosyltransferase family 4 protein [Hyphomicrobiales bacterium]|nr:glycosyltransferase family 4 protein [Hyphomicrobiales bacterium]MBV8824606.1 glycosyltransferase family 4 protein [Hyphomicrobiales bacterium]